jgi:osmotically-inducible protein OsmY
MRVDDAFTLEPLHATLALIGALTIVSGFGACQATSEKIQSKSMHDASVTAAVQRALTTERTANFTRVDVKTAQGVVQLSGEVQTPEHRALAEDLTKRIDGVKRVHNNLQIQTAPP